MPNIYLLHEIYIFEKKEGVMSLSKISITVNLLPTLSVSIIDFSMNIDKQV